MAMTLEAVMSLADQAARTSQYSANSAIGESEQALSKAIAEARRQEEIIAAKAQGKQGKAEFDAEAGKTVTAPQAAAKIKKGMSPVDPVAQTSLLMMMPKAEQDYATLTYAIMAQDREMS